MAKDLSKEIKELQERISQLESMLSELMKPLQQVQSSTSRYVKLIQLLLEHGSLSPDMTLPEIKDPVSKEIVRALVDRQEQNISQITELVRSKRGTASRRIIRQRLQHLVEQNIVQKQQKGSLYVYSLSEDILKKWLHLLGFTV